ncbi:DsbA family protein [Cellulomonas edaphi]|uniref:Thioredoxin domain-containing protein n=1 Tax=Cellulomonas edaphi TaxID=3053468 RepID=A0ABT7S8B0_9CELL|nr:thioredoxin domain-containing protein [Cellulomons edaphi]MDM7831831.1 thioredoxin domain-containing protein [Cellulomons edaphi]
MSTPGAAPARSVDPERHAYGEPSAPVTVLEYGDLECPHCRAAAPVLRELVDTSQGQVRLVWRHFPLFEVHPHALTAALASEAAGERGRFWELHDRCFADQSHLADVDLRRHALALGLDPDVVAGVGAQRYAPAVEVDYLAGIAAGAQGTPTLFVGGQPFRERAELGRLRAAVDVALARARQG